MNSDQELHDKHSRLIEWQATFIQGLLASAIAFAIHETSDRTLTFSLAPIALAVGIWAAAFAFGILANHARQAATQANIGWNEAERVQSDQHVKKASKMFRAKSRASARYLRWQLWLLLAGAIVYVAGHAMHLAENSAGARRLDGQTMMDLESNQ